MRIDKEIEEDVFKTKEQEYKEQLIEIKALTLPPKTVQFTS